MSARIPLPRLREDLQIERGGMSYSGAPVWVVFDPIRNRFFRISFEMYQLLSVWNHCQNQQDLVAEVMEHFCRQPEDEEIEAVILMLDASFFLTGPLTGSWRDLHAKSRPHHGFFMQLIHNYLFFKIPVVRPQRFINATWPLMELVFSRNFLVVSLCAGIIGLYLVSRQWNTFIGTFPYVFSLEGAFISVLSIALVKCVHELGHAYTAHRYGCRIPTMGVAFMVMLPLLYTDVSDAWRLKSRRSRILIDSAGVLAELCVASFALLLWAFLPDGPLRSAVFVLATVSWIMSLLVNINPFMRFDGYYIFADFLGIENLQPRAFRHMRWRLRELLFGLGDQPIEQFPPRLDAIITIYAVLTTLYRLVLYVGIALLVYHFTIKIIGVVLFAVEVGFFMIRPVWSLLKEWWDMRNNILQQRRAYVSFAALFAVVLLLALPLSGEVRAPAIMMPQTFSRLFAQEQGQLVEVNVKRGQSVTKDQTLFVLTAPELIHELQLTRIEIDLNKQRLARIGASSPDLVQRGVVESELGRLFAKQDGLIARQDKLTVRAPFAGVVSDLNEELSPGQWISRKQQLGYIKGQTGTIVHGYVSGDDRGRIDSGSVGWFIPDDTTQAKVKVVLNAVAVSGARQIEIAQLTSQFNGKLAVQRTSENRLVPVAAQYAVIADVQDATVPLSQTRSGLLVLEGKPESFFAQAWRRILTVIVRESGT